MALQKIKETISWRVDSEEEAIKLIEDYKAKQFTDGYTVNKSGYVLKTKKSKGEIIDQYYIVSIQFDFTD